MAYVTIKQHKRLTISRCCCCCSSPSCSSIGSLKLKMRKFLVEEGLEVLRWAWIVWWDQFAWISSTLVLELLPVMLLPSCLMNCCSSPSLALYHTLVHAFEACWFMWVGMLGGSAMACAINDANRKFHINSMIQSNGLNILQLKPDRFHIILPVWL